MSLTRRSLLAGGATAAAALAAPPAFAALPATGNTPSGELYSGNDDRKTVQRWARDTWRSLVAMTDERTGLPADNISGSVTAPVRSRYTSPTNIGGYLWSAIVARDLGLISRREAAARMAQTMHTMIGIRHHVPSGMYFNWYDEKTGEVLTTDPDGTRPITPFVSSVDNGWFAAALMVVRNAEPWVRRLADELLDRMNFAY
jgi:hypothetical protein